MTALLQHPSRPQTAIAVCFAEQEPLVYKAAEWPSIRSVNAVTVDLMEYKRAMRSMQTPEVFDAGFVGLNATLQALWSDPVLIALRACCMGV